MMNKTLLTLPLGALFFAQSALATSALQESHYYLRLHAPGLRNGQSVKAATAHVGVLLSNGHWTDVRDISLELRPYDYFGKAKLRVRDTGSSIRGVVVTYRLDLADGRTEWTEVSQVAVEEERSFNPSQPVELFAKLKEFLDLEHSLAYYVSESQAKVVTYVCGFQECPPLPPL